MNTEPASSAAPVDCFVMLLSDQQTVAGEMIADASRRLSKLYAETVEAFARSVGVDESNVQECEFREMRWGDLPECILRLQELWRKNVLLGQVVVRLDDSDGIRYVVECQRFDHGEGCGCQQCAEYHDECRADAASY